ncbi:thiamine biosynthesis protein ThiS [Chitinispirillum alkaliphilum]|nr:thiamine biosynthesis protein ThiS [Chitinispirillum alkaliphilum]
MEISVNGEKKILEGSELSVLELLQTNKVDMPDMVSVQLNGEFVQRQQYKTALVKDGDEVDFLYFMGGGQ